MATDIIAPRYMAGLCCDDGEGSPPDGGSAAGARILSRVGDRLELAGNLAWPEAARRCLGADDAMELVDLDPAEVAGVAVSQSPPADALPYSRYFDDIRAVMLRLIGGTDRPLPTRLFLAAYFADRVTPFFYRGVEIFEESALADEMERVSLPEAQAELASQFEAASLPSQLAMAMVMRILTDRLTHARDTPFGALVREVLNSYYTDPAAGGSAGAPLADLQRDQLLAAYEGRRDAWQSDAGDLLDRYATNYAVNYWLKDFYTGSPTLLVHTQNLLLRLALLRFLLISHPALLAVRPGGLELRRRMLAQTAVDVVTTFVGGIEGDPGFLRTCEDALARAGMQTLPYTMLLARF